MRVIRFGGHWVTLENVSGTLNYDATLCGPLAMKYAACGARKVGV